MAADGPTWLVENESGFPATMIAIGNLPMKIDGDDTDKAAVKAPQKQSQKDGKGDGTAGVEGGTATKRKAKAKASVDQSAKKKKTAGAGGGAGFTNNSGICAKKRQQLPAAHTNKEQTLKMIADALQPTIATPTAAIVHPTIHPLPPIIPFDANFPIDLALLDESGRIDKESFTYIHRWQEVVEGSLPILAGHLHGATHAHGEGGDDWRERAVCPLGR